MNNKSFHILFAGTAWPLETFLMKLAEGLCDRGYTITVTGPQKPEIKGIPSRDTRWLPTPLWKGFFPVRLWRIIAGMAYGAAFSRGRLRIFLNHAWKAAGALKKLQTLHRLMPFLKGRWDLIYFPWNSSAIELLPLFSLDIPTVLSCRGSQVMVAPHNPMRIALRSGLETTFGLASGVHCVSQSIKNEASIYGLSPEKTKVIYTPIDTDFFQPVSRPRANQEQISLITAGHLLWVKGFEYGLEAVRILVETNVPVFYTIIGSGEDAQRLHYTIRDMELENHVRVIPRQPQAALLQYYQNAHAYLLPSLSEGISNSALEAMACGLPVIGFNCGGMAEAVEHDWSGILVQIRNAEALAGAVQNIWNCPEQLEKMGQNARITVLGKFKLNDRIGDYADFFARAGAE